MELKFPKGFLWGAATSAHQVEGGTNNDWAAWERVNAGRLAREAALRQSQSGQSWPKDILSGYPSPLEPVNYISGRACDHYNRFREDFDIAKELGHNAHRFSIEWSRIEPEEGKFDEEAIEHYREVIKSLRQRGLEPFVTINHWTLPRWFAKRGGWENSESVMMFGKFVDYLVKAIGQQATFWITLNEPWVYITHSYLQGLWPPQKKSWWAALKVFKNLLSAHKTAFNVIKSYNHEAQVGIAENNVYFEGWAKSLAHWWINQQFFNLVGRRMDFIGLNYYFHSKIKGFRYNQNDNERVSDMGWETYPKGIYHVLESLKKYKRPIYITENGIADCQDKERRKFIVDHLFHIQKAINDNIDVRGYFYWSLLDNFEWDKGFWPRFGLVEVDYKTMERKIRPSALEYSKICKTNVIASDDAYLAEERGNPKL